jgi:hypothetical protein
MATTAPTPTWSYGNVVNYTDSGVTDDTEQWGYGNILSFLEYAAGGVEPATINVKDEISTAQALD